MIQEKLKKDTRPDHDRLEKLMFVDSIMDGTLSLLQYKKILVSNYLVHEALEGYLFNAVSHQLGEELRLTGRHKLRALLLDLEDLNLETPRNPAVEWTNFRYDNDPMILGALYVLEGATLGGHVILKKLAVNSMLNFLNLGFHYYRVYGDELIPNWKLFCEILNKQPDSAYPLILSGAKKMFAQIEIFASAQAKSSVYGLH